MLVGNAEDHAWFVGLVRRLFPDEAEAVLTAPDDTETQQSLSSWAEFMAEEPVKPAKISGRPKHATLSMFEWELSLEQEREEETVSAG